MPVVVALGPELYRGVNSAALARSCELPLLVHDGANDDEGWNSAASRRNEDANDGPLEPKRNSGAAGFTAGAVSTREIATTQTFTALFVERDEGGSMHLRETKGEFSAFSFMNSDTDTCVILN